MPKNIEDSMYEHYFSLLEEYRKKYGKVILFYQCGTFYEVYGLYDNETNTYNDEFNSSNDMSKILDSHVAILSNRKYKGYSITETGYPLATPLSKNVPKLIKEGWTVPVWRQSAQNKQVRTLYNIFSAGTSWFNDTNKLSNCFTDILVPLNKLGCVCFNCFISFNHLTLSALVFCILNSINKFS